MRKQAPAGVLPPHRAKRAAGTPVPVPHKQCGTCSPQWLKPANFAPGLKPVLFLRLNAHSLRSPRVSLCLVWAQAQTYRDQGFHQTQPRAAVLQIFHHPREMNRGRGRAASTGRSASTPPRETRGGDPGAGATRAMRDSDTSRAAPPGLTSLFLLTQGLRPGLPSRRASPPQQAKPGLARGPGSGAGFGTGRPDRRLENVHARAVPHLM